MLRPSLTRGRNRTSQCVATRGCKRDIVRDGAVATGVPYPLMCDECSLGTVESRGATRRCLIPCGTASPDAVPQHPVCRSPSPRQACDSSTETRPAPAFLRPQISSPEDSGQATHGLPYLFGMVINSGLSHKCHSRELCGGVSRLTPPHW